KRSPSPPARHDGGGRLSRPAYPMRASLARVKFTMSESEPSARFRKRARTLLGSGYSARWAARRCAGEQKRACRRVVGGNGSPQCWQVVEVVIPFAPMKGAPRGARGNQLGRQLNGGGLCEGEPSSSGPIAAKQLSTKSWMSSCPFFFPRRATDA